MKFDQANKVLNTRGITFQPDHKKCKVSFYTKVEGIIVKLWVLDEYHTACNDFYFNNNNQLEDIICRLANARMTVEVDDLSDDLIDLIEDFDDEDEELNNWEETYAEEYRRDCIERRKEMDSIRNCF